MGIPSHRIGPARPLDSLLYNPAMKAEEVERAERWKKRAKRFLEAYRDQQALKPRSSSKT